MPAAAFAPPAAAQPLLRSEWRLSTEHSLLMRVERGDRLRVLHGTVWIAAEGRGPRHELVKGNEHATTASGVLWIAGRDQPRIEVRSRQPLRVTAQADFGRWHHGQ